jgi:hypothetical protein
VEKKGIPTVTITTSSYENLARKTLKDQGTAEIALVVTEHPIAGHNPEGIKKKVAAIYPALLNAATQWQPGK